MYLHGAHVSSWVPNCAEEILFLSAESEFKEGKAIRGGIPICFPWFGPKKDDKNAPSHGFVRTRPWTLENIEDSGTDIRVSMYCESSPETRQWWDFDFRIQHEVRFGTELQCDLQVMNTGSNQLTFEVAQHTYFHVGDIDRVQITGLEGTRYLDKVAGGIERLQEEAIVFRGETDRIYLNTLNPVTLLDASTARKCIVEKNGSRNTVIWNPWIDKARALRDFGDDEYRVMACIETACIGEGSVSLESGQQHTMTSLYRVLNA